ncbi:MAG: PadR family transcriptional regulator [Pseudonocardiaceae bacterium]
MADDDIDGMGRFSDPAVLLMTSLADGPKHGHAISKDVARFSGVTLGPGTLYGALARLEAKDLIEALASDQRRQPYRLTTRGSAILAARLHAMEQVATTGLRRLSTA